MQRIIINESDLTSNVEVISSYDVAYVPGFMYGNDDVLATYYRKPTLFTNRYAFSNAIGSDQLPTFNESQPYPVFAVNKETGAVISEGFTAKAIPDSGEMFAANDIDLGYRIALYLLSLGMPVYYEVMNNTVAGTFGSTWTYTKCSDQDVFNSNISYYTKKEDVADYNATITDYSSNFTATPTVDTTTFSSNVSYKVGTYTFTGVATETTEEQQTQINTVWTLNDEEVVLTQYGITATTPTAGNYTFTVNLTSTLDDVVSQSVAPDTTDSWFELAVTVNPTTGNPEPITEWDPDTTYYTMIKTDTCPISVTSMYAGLKNRFIEEPGTADSSFDSMGDYAVKFITTGGYPTFEYCTASPTAFPLMSAIMQMAADRKDAIALIDHTNNPTRDLYPSTLGGSGNSVIDIMRNVVGTNIANGEYGAMFTPWYDCSAGAINMTGALSSQVPASVGYLSALAIQARDYNPWLAVSGVTRGRVPNLSASDNSDTLHTVQLLTNNIADAYQTLPTDIGGITQISINPITYIRNVGYCIWGNRTLRNNTAGTSALSFLNIRSAVCDIKKLIYSACQNNLFEQNTDITWLNFKNRITPLLDRMVSNYILTDYAITRYLIDPETGDPVPAYKVLAVIRIQPINSIEVFDLTVQLENSEVVVAEA